MASQQRTVLLIHPEGEKAKTYSWLLQSDPCCHYKLIEIQDTAQLVDRCKASPIDGILLELTSQYPRELELLNRLKLALGESTPPIVVIGDDSVDAAVAALKAGAADYLVKARLSADRLHLGVGNAIQEAKTASPLPPGQPTPEPPTNQKHPKAPSQPVETSSGSSQQPYQNLVERFQLATKAVNGLVYDWNVETNDIYRSEQLFDLIGFHPQAVPPTMEWWCSLIHPQDLAELQPKLKTMCEGDGEFYESEYRVRHRQGHWVEVWERTYLVRNDAGRVVRIVGSTVDISEKQATLKELRQAELALRQNQEQLSLAMQVAQMGSWDWNIQTGEVVWSANLQHMLGMAPGSFDGRYESVIAMLHPEDRDRVQEAIRRAIEEGEDYHIEFRFIKPDGTIRWALEAAKVFYDATGIPLTMTGVDMDITARKQAELDLRETHIQLESALSAGKIYTWRWHIPTNRVVTSQSFARLFGVDPDHAMAGLPIETFLGAVHREDRPRVTAAIDQAIASNSCYSTEFRISKPNGEVRWCFARGQVEYDSEGNAIAFPGALTDITDRKQAETTLAQQEARLRAFAESNVIGILQGDIYGNIHWANDEFLRLVGYTHQDVKAQRLRWDDLTPPEYRELEQQKIAEARQRGACTPYEKVYLHKDGRRVPVLIGYSLVGKTQEETVVFVLDLTERRRTEKQLRRSEDRLRMAVESTQMGTWDWKLPTNTLIWDATSKVMFGLSAEASETLEDFFAALHPEDRPSVEAAIRTALDPTGDGNFGLEYRIIDRRDRQERWIASQGQAYFRSDGTPDRLIGMMRDITEQKQVEAQREELLHREYAAREAAERANRIKDEFLAILSHELRSPLNPILGWAKLLQTKAMGPEKTARALSTIERNAKLQAQLIDDLLDIARILRGKLKLDMAPVNLDFVIQAAVETVYAAAKEKDITIQVKSPIPLQVQGDAGRLQQIVWNLLTNAIKFTPKGGRVAVQLEQVSSTEGGAGYQVSGTGAQVSGAGYQVSGESQDPIPDTRYPIPNPHPPTPPTSPTPTHLTHLTHPTHLTHLSPTRPNHHHRHRHGDSSRLFAPHF
jgi:PAS domain S-box-containing protein